MRRRRKDSTPVEETPEPALAEAADQAPPAPARPQGPWDVADRPLEEGDPDRVDLGGLSIAGHPDLEVRLQVDEASGAVAAALLVGPDGVLELRPFAASRNHAMWEDARAEIRADVERQGIPCEEVDGPYGTALRLTVQGQTPDGETVTQETVLLGVDGPRWLLRVAVYGRPAVDWQDDGLLETMLREVVVVRGGDPMPPGDALPLRLPPEARRTS